MRGLVVGTGPSLRDQLHLLPRFDGRLFVLNNCWSEDWVREQYEQSGNAPVWIACDPKWHQHYGQQRIPAWMDAWHWDYEIADRFGYNYIEGVWHHGLWLEDKTKISLNHGSAPQAINLAFHYGCSEIVLVGHDFDYPTNQPRHYFSNLSDVEGEYPEALRKWSKFIKSNGMDDLLAVYGRIAETADRPIWNATSDSKLTHFPYRDLREFLA